METFDFGRRIRDVVLPEVRKTYHVTGHYLSLEAAAGVIAVVRLGLLSAGCGELTEEQLLELGTVLEYQVHPELRPKSGEKKDVVSEIERLWAERQATHASLGGPSPKAPGRVKWVVMMALLGM